MSKLKIPQGAHAVFVWDNWTLYELPQRADESILWYSFKLMLPPVTPSRWRQRRGFVLGWNPVDLRFRKDSDRAALELGRPDLYMRVETFMCLSYDPEWLRDVQGITDTEIQAERVRLRTLAAERRAAHRASAAPAAKRA